MIRTDGDRIDGSLTLTSTRTPAVTLDHPRVIEALRAYREALESGGRPDRQDLVERFPEIAGELAACLDGLEFVHTVAPHLRGSDRGTSDAKPQELHPAAALGDFRILREIGRGGMGIVYEAEQLSLGRRVALKVLPFAAMMDSKQLQRFKNEAHAAAQLHHQNIVPVYFVGSDRGVHYYAMQFIEGNTLAEVIRELRCEGSRELGAGDSEEVRSAFPIVDSLLPTASVRALSTERTRRPREFYRTVARLGIQAAEALDYAHQVGIIHRDVKPGNLLLDLRGNLWITDFGLARVGSDADLTMTGDFLGTLRYMSPEQALARRVVVDHRTDIYSLGATLYEVLTLSPVFAGNDRPNLLRQIVEDEPLAPRRLDGCIPVTLETIVLKAMSKDPARRYATAQELAQDLRNWLEHKPICARRPSFADRLAMWGRRHRPLVRLTVAVLLLAVVLLAASTTLIWQARVEADRQRSLANAEREQARRRAQQAREVVDQMYTELAEQWLANQAHLEGLQQKFLVRAREFYEDFARGQSEDPAVLAEVAEANRRVGQIYLRFGDLAKAEPSLDEAVRISRSLVDHEAENARHVQILARSLRDRSVLDIATWRFPEAEQRMRDSLDLGKRYCRLALDDPQSRLELAEAYECLAAGYLKSGRFAAAGEPSTAAVSLLRHLTAEFPGDRKYLFALTTSLRTHGLSLACTGNQSAAQERFRQGLACLEELLKEEPTRPDYRTAWARLQNSVARAQIENGEEENAQESFRQSTRVWNSLVIDFPKTDAYRESQIQTYINFYTLLTLSGDHRAAVSKCREALAVHPGNSTTLETLAWLLADSPVPEIRDLFDARELAENLVRVDSSRTAWNVLGIVLFRHGKFQASIAAFDEAIELGIDLIGTSDEHPHWGVPSPYPYQCNRFFLAMAYWQLGRADKAHAWYGDGLRVTERYKQLSEQADDSFHPWDWLPERASLSLHRLERYRQEAARLLGLAND